MLRNLTSNQRKYIYGVAMAVIALLVAYNIMSEEDSGVWAGFVTAMLGLAPMTAMANITQDEEEAPQIPTEDAPHSL